MRFREPVLSEAPDLADDRLGEFQRVPANIVACSLKVMDERTGVVEPFNKPASAENAIERANKPTSTPFEDRKR